ncbi:hypothetical protein GCM10009845_10450 [Pedococcus bigeumensis]
MQLCLAGRSRTRARPPEPEPLKSPTARPCADRGPVYLFDGDAPDTTMLQPRTRNRAPMQAKPTYLRVSLANDRTQDGRARPAEVTPGRRSRPAVLRRRAGP